jgi:hypothetical protein
MNIFVVDENPVTAARSLCDKHVVKMVLESAQMLSTAKHVLGAKDVSDLYKPTHVNHPCNIWIRESYENYLWLYNHYVVLTEEYNKRYGKLHASFYKNTIGSKLANVDGMQFPKKILTPFAIAMKNYPDCIVPGNAVESYRNYYRTAKKNFATWKTTTPPSWFY